MSVYERARRGDVFQPAERETDYPDAGREINATKRF